MARGCFLKKIVSHKIMISKISKLNKIGKFSSISQEKNFQYGDKGQNCNIIFGFNGSGKTTLSNAISFFADNSFISEEEKEEIFDDIKNDNEAVVELSLQGGSNIKYPDSNDHNKNFYIFNPNFVTTHVFDGTKGKLKKFSNMDGEIKNKEIDDINQRIEVLKDEEKKLEKEKEELDKQHGDITKSKSNNFRKTMTDKSKRLSIQDLSNVELPDDNIKNLEAKLSILVADYELSKKLPELSADLEELRQSIFDSCSIDFTKVDNLLTKNVQQLSKKIMEEKIVEIRHFFSDEQHQQNVEHWLRYGKDVLEKIDKRKVKRCPICSSDISNELDSVLKDYKGYFDESYEKFIRELKIKIDKVVLTITSLDQYEKSAEKLDKLCVKYQKLLNGVLFEKFNFTEIRNNLLELKKSLKVKNGNIQSILSKPPEIEKSFVLLNNALSKFKKLKTDVLKILDSKRINTNTIEDKIRKTYNEIIILEFNQLDKIGALKKYNNNKKRIVTIKRNEVEGLPFLTNKLIEELKRLKIESKGISKYLIEMGIDHFDIDINEERKEENIIIRYKSSTKEKSKLKNCLSDGEKTALAFAYFLSKFENEINTSRKIKESVVIIDDPVCSLDDNRLYSTAYLIYRNFENVKELIVLSHNFLFLKFFNSFYRTKANCLFLDGKKITDLPDELKNFETPYFYMLRSIINFLDQSDQNVTYNDAKKYLPNFIRRVLETFLSFEFSRTVNREGGYRSPGLNEFEENIDNTNMEDEVKKGLKNKIAKIKKISDDHSHGNAHYTQENFYISEIDLKILAKDAISVIETMDNLHKTCFVEPITRN